jgi:hypothetical protein
MIGAPSKVPRSQMSEEPTERPTGAITSLEDPPPFVASAVRFKDRHEAGQQVGRLAIDWLERHLAPSRAVEARAAHHTEEEDPDGTL